jgi:hypothetical protein
MQEFPLEKMLNKFGWKRLTRVGGEGHDARIGEWIRWWNENQPNHMVINPAPATLLQGKKVFADLLFLSQEKDTSLFNVVGVGEIENKRKKFLTKLDSLKAYIDNKLQYPDLKFALLSVCWYRDLEEEQYKETFEKVLKTLKDFSETSKQSWILHTIKYFKLNEAPFAIKIIDKVRGTNAFYYTYRNLREVEWCIIKEGTYLGEA